MDTTNHILVVSHPRSGTHLTVDSIVNNFTKWARPYLNLDRIRAGHAKLISVDDVRRRLEGGPHVIKSHMHADTVRFFRGDETAIRLVDQLLSTSKLVYVYRDGRDVMVSLFYYLRRFQPALANVSFSEFLRMANDQYVDTLPAGMTRPEFWAFHVDGWQSRYDLLALPFESLRYHYEDSLDELATFLDTKRTVNAKPVIRKPATISSGKRWIDRAQKVAMRLRSNVTSTSVDFRKGVSGDFASHFVGQDLDYFHQSAGATLERLGYS